MRTAVQLRADAAMSSEIVAGTPASVAQGRLGPIAIFEPDTIVAYLVRSPMGRSLAVFRTLAVDDSLAARVPGVAPRVRLLVYVRTAGRVRALRRLLHLLGTRRIDPSALRDAFYVRVSVALGGRRTDQARLRALLRREQSLRTGASASQEKS
jgi:hypothetical protein